MRCPGVSYGGGSLCPRFFDALYLMKAQIEPRRRVCNHEEADRIFRIGDGGNKRFLMLLYGHTVKTVCFFYLCSSRMSTSGAPMQEGKKWVRFPLEVLE